MYTCQLHNWQSISSPCPSCVRTIPSTTTNNFIVNPTPEVGKTMAELVYKCVGRENYERWNTGTIDGVFKAMSEWASLQCEAKDAEIKELREQIERFKNPLKGFR